MQLNCETGIPSGLVALSLKVYPFSTFHLPVLWIHQFGMLRAEILRIHPVRGARATGSHRTYAGTTFLIGLLFARQHPVFRICFGFLTVFPYKKKPGTDTGFLFNILNSAAC